MQNPKTGYDVYFSAPSGGGKSSLIKGLLKELDNIQLSVSVTTRAKREGETDGRDYYFINDDKFKELVEKKALYEYVDSDFGPKYGTPKKPVDDLLCQGKDVILDLDYPGVQQLRALAGDRVKAIALVPPSLKILRERLVNRGTDSMDVINRRMAQAEKESGKASFMIMSLLMMIWMLRLPKQRPLFWRRVPSGKICAGWRVL